ncbi:MAG: hypothetical protein ACXVCI_22245 [Bdellovibrionota bacterium]
MKNLILCLALLGSVPAFANDPPGNGVSSVACSDQNKAPALIVLQRMSQEAKDAHHDSDGIDSLIADIQAKSSVQISAQKLRDAGLSDAQSAEVFRSLQLQE